MTISPVSESALIIQLGERIDPEMAVGIGKLADSIRSAFGAQLIEVIPSYTTIYIQYHPLKVDYSALKMQLESLLAEAVEQGLSDNPRACDRQNTLILPVYYSLATGPDLAHVADVHHLAIDEVIDIHCETEYVVCAVGFAPGFAFLGNVDSMIATPRKQEPRVQLPAGSVGIADQQTAVYPTASPGGWQIIGNCPLSLFDPEKNPISPFRVGQTVRFQSVSREDFFGLGGQIWPHWKL